MSELRHDPLQRRWVIIASERMQRPKDFIVQREKKKSSEGCPFCPGHEDMTPPEIIAIRNDHSEPDTPGWRVRVTQNKFPALKLTDNPAWKPNDEFYESTPGLGTHEVIIEGTQHNNCLADSHPDFIFEILCMYRSRLVTLMNDNRLKYALIFKNHGSTAGASLAHPHSQIIAMPIVPRTVEIELLASERHYDQQRTCLICDMIKNERKSGSRVIFLDEAMIAFNSYAARFPFEMFVAPLDHHHDFSHASDYQLRHLAECLGDVLSRLKYALDDPPFNYILHTSPNLNFDESYRDGSDRLDLYYHWHLEIIPRLTRTAGFEWGSGLHINPMPPERAAEFLRSVEL